MSSSKEEQMTPIEPLAAGPEMLTPAHELQGAHGRWRLGEKIGEGGSATVFRATNVSSIAVGQHLPGRGEPVPPGGLAAVKLANHAISDYEKVLFGWEPQKARFIDSPWVLPTIDEGTSEGRPFFVMSLLEEGKTVRQHWREATN